METKSVPISLLVPAPYNPRTQRAPDDTLVESIKAHGVLEPLVVRPLGDGRYEIMAGERRYRAALKAGLTEVPVVVRDADDRVAFEIAVTENAARKDLDALEVLEAVLEGLKRRGYAEPEEAFRKGIRALKHYRESAEAQELQEVARALGLSAYGLAHYLPLLKIPADVRRAIKGRNIPLRRLLRVAGSPEAIQALVEALEAWRTGKAPTVPGLTPEQSLWSTFNLHVAPVLSKGRREKKPPAAKPLNRVEKLIWYLADLVEGLEERGLMTARMRELLEAFLDEAEEALIEADTRLTGIPLEAYYRVPREKLARVREAAQKR